MPHDGISPGLAVEREDLDQRARCEDVAEVLDPEPAAEMNLKASQSSSADSRREDGGKFGEGESGEFEAGKARRSAGRH